MKSNRFHSINFILWLSFLLFAAFIILITWVFQTSFLKLFLSREAEDDLDAFGANAYVQLKKYMAPGYDDEAVMNCIARLEEQNLSATIYIVFSNGQPFYATSYQTLPNLNEFYQAVNELTAACTRGEKLPHGKKIRFSDDNFVYVALLSDGEPQGADANSAQAYLYIDYSTELLDAAMGTVRVQMVLISIIVIFLALVISALLSIKLTRPITQITRAAKRMAAGDFTVNFKGEYSYAEMDALAETLDYAKEEIGKSDQLQKEVLANVTHDLKTPLTMIKAYASMIQEISGDNPEKRAKHTQVIIDESDRLTSLVNDILNLSKIRSGMDSLKIESINLSEFVHTVIERFDYLVETAGYSIERDIEDELYTDADVEKLEQVVYNLIGNAVNYTGDDKRIIVGLRRTDGGKIRFTVTDTGKGIPPEEIDTIWDRYYRSSETHKRPIRGTGLGLSIVKTILQKHGFEFGVESEVGKGSTFYVLFPEK